MAQFPRFLFPHKASAAVKSFSTNIQTLAWIKVPCLPPSLVFCGYWDCWVIPEKKPQVFFWITSWVGSQRITIVCWFYFDLHPFNIRGTGNVFNCLLAICILWMNFFCRPFICRPRVFAFIIQQMNVELVCSVLALVSDDAVTNFHKFSGIKQCKFIILKFCRLEVQHGSYWPKIKVRLCSCWKLFSIFERSPHSLAQSPFLHL